MSGLDPAAAEVLRILGAAAAGALAGGGIGELRARAAERRAEVRQVNRLRQDHLIRAISETQRDHSATSSWLLAHLTGDAEARNAVQYGDDYYPDASIYLLGDEDLIQQVVDLRLELGERTFGSGLRDGDIARLGALQGHVSARLAVQRERVFQGQEPLWPSQDFVEKILAETQERYSVPPEYRPPLKHDSGRGHG